MTKEEAIKELENMKKFNYTLAPLEVFDIAIKALEQEPTANNDLGVDWESYKDADGNSLDYLILNVLQNNFDCGDAYGYTVADKIISLLPSITPQEPFINKPCVSSGVCEHDKNVVIDKIRAEIQSLRNCSCSCSDGIIDDVEDILDKYKTESEKV